MAVAVTHVDRKRRTATVLLRGDIIIPTAQSMYGQLRGLVRRRDIRSVVIDFEQAGRVDSSGVAVISLIQRVLQRAGKQLALEHLGDKHKAALALLDDAAPAAPDDTPHPALVERVGGYVLGLWEATKDLVKLIGDVLYQSAQIVTRRKSLPKGALWDQAERMGVDALPIVALLGGLLGMTLAFQGVVLLHRFGAGQFVADMIGLSLVREFGPMMTAIIVAGRTGAAIAAELGTMRVRSELDALATMGVSPTRYLLLPRLLALTVVGPALSLVSMFVGIAGGMLVTLAVIHIPAEVFWTRIVERVTLMDFIHGLGKSVVFAWIIGLTASHFGMRTDEDATSVGVATTRTVVASIFFIILVDAAAATFGALGGG